MKKFLGQRKFFSSSTSESAFQNYCLSLVSQYDFESYLNGLLLPKHVRNPYFAIKAFNVEIASIYTQTRGNQLAGRMRCQWWKDSIAEIYEQQSILPFDHPVLHSISFHSKSLSLSKVWFDRSIDARQRDLTFEHPEKISDLEDYTEQAYSSIFYLLLETSNIKDSESMYAASHLGVCHGLITLLKGLHIHANENRVYLPKEILAKHNLSINSVLDLKNPDKILTEPNRFALRECVFEIAAQANGHLEAGLKFLETKKSDNSENILMQSLLSLHSARMYLDELQNSQFDINICRKNSSSAKYQLKQQYHLLKLKLSRFLP